MTTLLILSGFYIIWLAALLTVAYTPRLFHNYTLFIYRFRSRRD